MAEALVSFLVEQLGSITYQQVEQKVRLVVNVKKEVATLTLNLGAIQAVLTDAEMRQVKEVNVRRWLSNLKDVSYEIDDVLDEWSTEILKQQVEKQENEGDENAILAQKKVCFSIPFHCLCFGQVNQIIRRHDIAMRIKELNETLALIYEQRKFYNFHYLERVIEPERLKSISIVDKSGTFGRDYEKDFLVSQLLSENSQERRGPLVISIVGMGGIGKTTLAQLAYNDENVQAYFDKRIWVCVSEPFVQTEVAKSIIKSLNETVPNSNDLQTVLNSNDLETLGQHVYKSIDGKKFLLVLDDVWDSNHTKWDLFMRTLQSGARGSRILVTTRIEQVARVMVANTEHTIHLTELSEETCRSLFYHIAFFDGDQRKESRMFEEVGDQIVKKCKGLPLAAKTLGSLMRTKKTIQQWKDVLNSKIWEVLEVEQQVFKPLLLSYYDLEPPIKSCLLYCTTFPKDYVFYKDDLIELWMSQNYLNVKGDNKGNKTIGQRYFENLVMRSFFQDFEEDDDGNIIRCKMHDIVHDFVLYLTKDECSTVVVKGANERIELPGDEARHLTILFAPEGPFPVSFLNNSKSLRTLTSYSKLTSIGVEAISQLKCLRTLNLRSNPITEVPKEIGGLIHLRYLDLSRNRKLKELPDNLCDLYNLQTLRLTECSQLVKLPNEEAMRKLTNLKHLYVEGSCGLKSKGIRGLRNLKTLDEFHAHGGDDNEGLRLEDLEKLNQLEGTLSIRNLMYVKDASEATKAMTNVKHILLHLELDFRCQGCDPFMTVEERKLDGEILNALQPHPDLESLCIQQSSAKTLCPNWMMSLHKLTRLALLICPNCEILPPLGKLPSLESLKISWMDEVKKGVEFLGIAPSSSSSSGSGSAILFPKLKKLVFGCMEKWEEWEGVAGWTEDSEIKIMPSLNYLQFDTVPVLKTLPDFLRKTPLQHLIIQKYCPHLKGIVKQRSGEEWAKISHIPNIQLSRY